MHAALASSLASIVLTAASSAYAHHKRGSVLWPTVKWMVPGLLLGLWAQFKVKTAYAKYRSVGTVRGLTAEAVSHDLLARVLRFEAELLRQDRRFQRPGGKIHPAQIRRALRLAREQALVRVGEDLVLEGFHAVEDGGQLVVVDVDELGRIPRLGGAARIGRHSGKSRALTARLPALAVP